MAERLTGNYRENVALLDRLLRVEENFDILKKVVGVGQDELTFYYVDGFLKDGIIEKLMSYFVTLKSLGEPSGHAADSFMRAHVPYVETDLCRDMGRMVDAVLSGTTLMLGSSFLDTAILIDARTYPARETAEPENDRAMLGARDGFVETLIFNTALIRRRIRDTSLTMQYMAIGSSSRTDVVLCYMKGRAKDSEVQKLTEKLKNIKAEALPLGHQSLLECLLKSGWYNPFPKVRTTERPDNAAAHLLEGNILLIVDNSPEIMLVHTSIFDFAQETNDYYFPPLTGSYLRLLRQLTMLLTLFLTPLWFLLVQNPALTPDWLTFILPDEVGKIPILAQLLLTEFVIDSLRMASMNTPDMLSNSLAVVGGLILGDFAINIGWLIPEVILYMAFVAMANFSQRNYELSYAFKFLRIGLLILTSIFGIPGFLAGVVGILVLIATNKTLLGTRGYLYPLIPFNAKAFAALFFRLKKKD